MTSKIRRRARRNRKGHPVQARTLTWAERIAAYETPEDRWWREVGARRVAAATLELNEAFADVLPEGCELVYVAVEP